MRYDQARRRRGRRKGRERGVWIFIPAEELEGAGIDPHGPAPFYRLWHRPRAVLVQLYRDETTNGPTVEN